MLNPSRSNLEGLPFPPMLDIPIVALVHVLENVKNVSYLGGCCVFFRREGITLGLQWNDLGIRLRV